MTAVALALRLKVSGGIRGDHLRHFQHFHMGTETLENNRKTKEATGMTENDRICQKLQKRQKRKKTTDTAEAT